MKTLITAPDEKGITAAKELLYDGETVAFPTETVYGLGALATLPRSVARIFEIKGRPQDNPLIAHIHEGFDIEKIGAVEQPYAYKLIDAFMPGPLTLVLKNRRYVCDEATCGGETVAVRMPSNATAQKLLKAVEIPVVAPSANVSKHVSPVSAEHVYNDFCGKIPLILDGGRCDGGIESTVLDVTGNTPRILRLGLVTRDMIRETVGCCETAEHLSNDRVKSPGVKYAHYRPACETALFEADEKQAALSEYRLRKSNGGRPYLLCDNTTAEELGAENVLLLGATPSEMARNLYSLLREGEKKADIIIAVKPVCKDGVTEGVLNRLNKACL